jgi:hypothetical protein
MKSSPPRLRAALKLRFVVGLAFNKWMELTRRFGGMAGRKQ